MTKTLAYSSKAFTITTSGLRIKKTEVFRPIGYYLDDSFQNEAVVLLDAAGNKYSVAHIEVDSGTYSDFDALLTFVDTSVRDAVQ